MLWLECAVLLMRQEAPQNTTGKLCRDYSAAALHQQYVQKTCTGPLRSRHRLCRVQLWGSALWKGSASCGPVYSQPVQMTELGCLQELGGAFLSCCMSLTQDCHLHEQSALQDDADMADWEEAAGISAPLYEIVDTVFELQSRGFFRRQVSSTAPQSIHAHAIEPSIAVWRYALCDRVACMVARQVLPPAAVDAIIEWLLPNLRTPEHILPARAQVFGLARQMLPLAAGGAIIEWPLSDLRALRMPPACAGVWGGPADAVSGSRGRHR